MVHEKDKVDISTGEIKKVNANFFQIYKDNVDLLIEIGQNNKTALNIFLWIAKHMDDRNALVVSQETIAEQLKITTRTVRYAIANLKESKALTILKSGSTNIYALNSKIVWQDDAENKKYAHFTAKVYITEFEQEQPKIKTELFGHAIKKQSKQPNRIKKAPKEAIKDFELELV
jgi:biotin operon repressor